MSKKIPSKDKILSQIKVSSTTPIHCSREDYLDSIATKIQRKIRFGSTLEDAANSIQNVTYIKRKNIFPIIALTTVVSVVFIAGGLGINYLLNIKNDITPQNTDAVSSDDYISGKDFSGENILFVGTDQRPIRDEGDGSRETVPGIRTDVIVLITIPKDKSKAYAISYPRDLNINTKNCEMFDYKKSEYLSSPLEDMNNVKINSIYEKGGPKCLTNVVENYSGQKISRYVQFNFDGFKSIVDSVGGVDIQVDTPIIDDVLGTIVETPGLVHMDGKKALQYSRARKVNGTSKSDFDRIDRQRKVVKAVMDKTINSADISNPNKIISILSSASDNMMVDNLSINDFPSLFFKMKEIGSHNIKFITMPIKSENGPEGNLIGDKEGLRDIYSAINTGRKMYGEEVKNSGNSFYAKTTAIKGDNITILSKNRNDSRAKAMSKILEEQGSHVTIEQTFGDVPENTEIKVNSKNAGKALTVGSIFPKIYFNTKKNDQPHHYSQLKSDIVIEIGEDGYSVVYGREGNIGDYRANIPLESITPGDEIVPFVIPKGILATRQPAE